MLALIYHCGLRVGEAVALKPGHIDAQRGVVRIVEGKGGRMREVPISCAMVERLCRYWSFHRNKRWLFAGVGRGWKDRTRSLSQAMPTARRGGEASCAVSAACISFITAAITGRVALRGTRAGRVGASKRRGSCPCRTIRCVSVPAEILSVFLHFPQELYPAFFAAVRPSTEGRRLGYVQTGRTSELSGRA